MVACIEDNAMDEAHSKLSWHCDRYQDAIKNTNLLQEQLNSEKECHCKVESELHHLQKEGKIKESREKALPHANGMSGSPPRTLTLLSKCSARHPGNDSATTQVHQMFRLGE